MKTVVFNGISLCGGYQLGIHRYESELLKRLDVLSPEINFEICLAIPEGLTCELPLKTIKEVEIGPYRQSRLSKHKWIQKVLPSYVERTGSIGIDLTWGLPSQSFAMVGVHDCICESFPEDNPGIRGAYTRIYHIYRMKRVLKNKEISIITLSETSAKEISKQYGVPTSNMHVIPCGWEHILGINSDHTILNKLGINPREYYFTLGSKYPHKNLNWIVDAACINPNQIFVVSGTSAFCRNSLTKELPSNILETGYISDGEMKALMENAKALVQPSFAEGFGLPPIEALSLGTPAIVSSTSCFPEIYGKAVTYLDPHDASSVDLSDAPDFNKENVLNVLERYSWNRSTTKLVSIINKIIGNNE